MKQKTIAFFTPYFPPFGGGLERYAREIAIRLQRDHGWRVVIVASGARAGDDTKTIEDGMTIYRLGYSMKISNTPFAFHWIGKVRSILRNEDPDLINIHMPVPGIGDIAYSLAGSRPFIVTYHMGSMNKGRTVPDFLIWIYEHISLPFVLRRADTIIATSDWVRSNFLETYRDKCVTVTPAVDGEIFKPALADKSPHPTILFVAGLAHAEEYKGLGTLLDALPLMHKENPHIRLTVIGDGDAKGQYESYADQLGLKHAIRFTGRLSGTPLVAEYQKSHMFCLPTSKDNFPLTILEAMSSGLPVVTTTVGDIPSLVENDRTGYLVAPKNPFLIARKCLAVLRNLKRLSRMSDTARARVAEGFTWDKRAARYDEIFSSYNLEKSIARKIRILETPVRFFPYIGGVENHAYYLSEQLVRLGYDVSVVCANEPLGSKQETLRGIAVRRLDYLFKMANTNITPMLPLALWNADVDIIHAHMPTPWTADWSVLIAKLRSKTSLLTIHNDMDKPDTVGKWMTWIYIHTVFRLTLHLSDRIIINPYWKETFGKTAEVLAKYGRKIVTIPNGVDLELFYPPSRLADRNTILFVSILDAHHRFKGFDYLLEAMPEIISNVGDARLVAVGAGALVDEYREKARRLGLADHVRFAGGKTQSELLEYYQSATVFVLPSIEIEGFGIVVLEALACGVPVVSTNVVGIAPEITARKTGIVVPPRDHAKLAEAIVSILENKDERARMSARGLDLILENYSWEKIAAVFSRMLSQIAV